MPQNLKKYFPMIQTREEILHCINTHAHLQEIFEKWKPKEQTDFLDICTGVHGVKTLYDAFFKEIMNPEYAPQRLNDFLSLILNKTVRVMKVLPNDSSRLTDESSLLIMDIVVEFEDRSIGNIEVQKLGYLFPGQRSACYSGDLLLRQYKRLRDEKEAKFSYRDIQSVYTIVLFEKSPKEFQLCPENYLHHLILKADTGIEIDMPQKFVYITLDIFRKKQQNEGDGIHSKLEAWLTFFCRDEPEMILKFIRQYPEFKPLYADVYELCRNMEEIMQIFSKELLEMDRNTVKLMIDEMQEEIQNKEQTISAQARIIESQNNNVESLMNRIAELEKELSQK